MTDFPTMPRVLVGVDFDDASAAALKMAAALAAASQAELTVFHAAVEAVPAYFTTAQIGQLVAEREQTRAAVAIQVHVFAEQQVSPVPNVVIGEGPPQDAIVRLAPAYDLIVVGTHRRHGAQRWWLGSVAEAIVRESPRPVLVVPAGAVLDTRRAPTILAAGADTTAADAGAEALRIAFGGSVIRSSDIHHCAPDRLEEADLIVLSVGSEERHSRLSGIAHVLKACVHPVLFVPSEHLVERSRS